MDTKYTRREFAQMMVAAVPAAAAATACAQSRGANTLNSTFNGVKIAVQTYSYRSMFGYTPGGLRSMEQRRKVVDTIANSVRQNGIEAVEFWIAPMEPVSVPYNYGAGGSLPTDPKLLQDRETLRQWRESRPMELFQYAQEAFSSAGIQIYSAMFNLSETCTDEEILAACDMAEALGTKIMTVNPSIKGVRRAGPLTLKRGIKLGVHNHNFVNDPDDFATAEALVEATTWSPNIGVTLDIGHFVAGNGDPVRFVREHHDKIVNLHLKDRYKDDQDPHSDDNVVEWGEGDTPIAEVLQEIVRGKYSFPATIEYEYPGKESAVVEVGKCLEFARRALVAA